MAEGAHMKLIYGRNSGSGVSDDALTTHDFWTDASIGDTESGAIWTAVQTWWNSIRDRIAADVALKEARFYYGYNGDGSPGTVDKSYTANLAGEGLQGQLPPQVACSVTEIIDGDADAPQARRHWGRFYIPGIDKGQLTAAGRLTSAAAADIATATQVLYNAWNTQGNPAIIWVKTPTVLTHAYVEAIRVDDVLDVIRRRRWESTLLRETRACNHPAV